MQTLYERILEATSFLQKNGVTQVQVAAILGSGLGTFADTLREPISIPYATIPGFVATGVQGHTGRLVFGKLPNGASVVVLQGRVHYYEGHSMQQVVFPTRVLAALGIRSLVITNAAGGVNLSYQPGDLVIIRDHLNLTGQNPLLGPNDERIGKRFPDMTQAYPADLRKVAHEVSRSLGFSMPEGVYAALTGPTYETPSEVKMLRGLGADLVGMSTVPEVIAAVHTGVRVLGVSCVTNLAAGVSEEPIEHSHIEAVAALARERFIGLLTGVLARLSSDSK